mmetsp:Transcript_941/g.3968  ORF Transcript_941/g.3968 Transcript_941/m.3968 type:complete len:317 (-) Transcript_941:216-1166(-)
MTHPGRTARTNASSSLYGACREYATETMRPAAAFSSIGASMPCALAPSSSTRPVPVAVPLLSRTALHPVGKIASGGASSCRSPAASERSVDGRTCCFGTHRMFVRARASKASFADRVIKSAFSHALVPCMKRAYDDTKYLLSANSTGHPTASLTAHAKSSFPSESTPNMIGRSMFASHSAITSAVALPRSGNTHVGCAYVLSRYNASIGARVTHLGSAALVPKSSRLKSPVCSTRPRGPSISTIALPGQCPASISVTVTVVFAVNRIAVGSPTSSARACRPSVGHRLTSTSRVISVQKIFAPARAGDHPRRPNPTT